MKLKSVPPNYSQTIVEVTSLPDYKRYVASKTGYFLRTDNGTPDMIHAVDCSHYRGKRGEKYFEEKVVTNKRRNGQYFYSKSLPDLKKWSGATECDG